MPTVSVVISTKNEEKNIRACLESITRQSYTDFELIVVDNDSKDKTKEISREFTPLVYNVGPERSAQRNYGVKSGSGKYALYLDADMTLSPDVIKECVEKMDKDQNLAGLYIPETVIGNGFWISVRRFERGFYDGTVIDAVRFVRRSVFLDIGGFDERLVGPEDWDFDLSVRQHGSVAIIRSPLFHNEGDFSFWIYIRKKSYYAKSFNEYVKKWGVDHPVIHKQLGVKYRYMGVYLENGKFLRMLGHPILATSMLFLRFLVGLVYLARAK